MAGSRAQTLLRPSRDWTPLTQVGALTLSAGVITDVTRLAGVEGDGGDIGDGVGVWPAATNLVTNGGFETNTTGWAKNGSGEESLDRVTTTSKFGSACLRVTLGGAVSYDGAKFSGLALTNGTAYTFGAWVRCETGTLALRIQVIDATAATLGTTNFTATTSWQRVSVTVTADADTPFLVRIINNTGAVSTAVYYVDGVQLETGSIATPYIETDGGTASRVAGTAVLASPSTKGISGVQGGFVMRLRPGWGNSAEPSSPRLWVMRGGSGIYCYYETSTNVWRISPGNAEPCNLAAAITSGDSYTVYGYWKAAQCGIGYNGSALTTAARTLTCTATSLELLYDSLVASREFNGTVEWAAFFGENCEMTDADGTLFNSWGNTDPLPHQFPRSLDLVGLARFNGDGTAYRYSA